MTRNTAALVLHHPAVHHALSSATQPSDIGHGLLGAAIVFCVVMAIVSLLKALFAPSSRRGR